MVRFITATSDSRWKRKANGSAAMDTLIAAHALAAGARLVTNNCAEFKRVPGLKRKNWMI
jgi:predicted nucleic acid-binding protein